MYVQHTCLTFGLHVQEKPSFISLFSSACCRFYATCMCLILNDISMWQNFHVLQAPRDAKQQIEDAMMAVMEKRHAMDEAAHAQT